MSAWRIEMLRHSHDYVQNQIALGDAKAGGVLAWNAVLVAWLANKQPLGPGLDVLTIMSAVAVVCLAVSVLFAAYALLPRTPAVGLENRISLVDISRCSQEHYTAAMEKASAEDCIRDLCGHIHLLAGIASRKFQHIQVALVLAAVASALMILSLAL